MKTLCQIRVSNKLNNLTHPSKKLRMYDCIVVDKSPKQGGGQNFRCVSNFSHRKKSVYFLSSQIELL